MSTESSETVEFETTFRNDRTIITIEGNRDIAVVVRSKSGERIYLPPEDAVQESQNVVISPYHPGLAEDDDEDEDDEDVPSTSPYERMGEQAGPGGPSGIRIVHPERATDVRVLR